MADRAHPGAAGLDVIAFNAHILCARIDGAELKLWPEAGHLYPTDDPPPTAT